MKNIFLIFLFSLLGSPLLACAQSTPPSLPTTETKAANLSPEMLEIQNNIEKISNRLTQVNSDLASQQDQIAKLNQQNQTPDVTTEQSQQAISELEYQVEHTRNLRISLERQLQIWRDLDGQEKELEDLKKDKATAPTSTQAKSAPSFADLEAAREENYNLNLTLNRLQEEKLALSRDLERLTTERETKEAERRKIKEEQEKEPHKIPSELAKAELDLILLNEDIKLYQARQKKLLAEESSANIKLERSTWNIRALRHSTKLDKQFLEDKFSELKEREEKLKQLEINTRRDLLKLQQQWDTARQKANQQTSASNSSTPDQEVSLVDLETKRLAMEGQRSLLDLLSKRIFLLTEERTLWERRAKALKNKADLGEVRQWRKDGESKLENLRIARNLASARQEEFRKLEYRIVAKLDEVRGSMPELTRVLTEQARVIRKIEQDYLGYLDEGNRFALLCSRYNADLKEALEEFNLGEKMSEVWSLVVLGWNYEILAIDERPITIGKILLALFLFSIGLYLSRYLSRQLGRKILPHFHTARGVAAALESFAFYALLVLSALIALRVVNVPLTIFTLLGGAVAIGVGFGSQNIISNFISGIILLIEQPVRVGDIIEFDGITGCVERIGMRSSIVKTGRNISIIVPNTKFLDQRLSNWTLHDNHVVSSIAIGVSYSSDLNKVTEILEDVARGCSEVISSNPPRAYVTEFGSNSIKVELSFSLGVIGTDRSKVQSTLMKNIISELRQAGVTVPCEPVSRANC